MQLQRGTTPGYASTCNIRKTVISIEAALFGCPPRARPCETQETSHEEPPMLILTRRVGETIKVGDDVAVTFLGVKGAQVRIGITAPKDVAVHREEIYDAR